MHVSAMYQVLKRHRAIGFRETASSQHFTTMKAFYLTTTKYFKKGTAFIGKTGISPSSEVYIRCTGTKLYISCKVYYIFMQHTNNTVLQQPFPLAYSMMPILKAFTL